MKPFFFFLIFPLLFLFSKSPQIPTIAEEDLTSQCSDKPPLDVDPDQFASVKEKSIKFQHPDQISPAHSVSSFVMNWRTDCLNHSVEDVFDDEVLKSPLKFCSFFFIFFLSLIFENRLKLFSKKFIKFSFVNLFLSLFLHFLLSLTFYSKFLN